MCVKFGLWAGGGVDPDGRLLITLTPAHSAFGGEGGSLRRRAVIDLTREALWLRQKRCFWQGEKGTEIAVRWL